VRKYLQKVIKGIKPRSINIFLFKNDKTRFNGELCVNLFKKNSESLGFIAITRNKTTKDDIKEEFYGHYQKIGESFSKQAADTFNKIKTNEYTEIRLLKTTWQLNQLYQELAKQKKLLENEVESAKKTIDELKKEIKLERRTKEELVNNKTRFEKLLEEQNIEFHERIEENDKIKIAFLNNISHEIRTPLNGILGFTHLMVNTNCNRVTRRIYADAINYSSKQLLDIMNDIIDLSKIESGDFISNEKEICLNKELDDIYSHYKKIAEEKSIEFIRKTDKTQDNLEILINQYMLRGALFKLLDNAFKFTNEGYIETGYNILKSNKIIRFYIKDTGIGISDKYHDFIFKKFSKVDSSSAAKYGGCGIGLTIAKAFTEKLGGAIWVESEENEGSTFYFSVSFKECNIDDSAKEVKYDKPVIPKFKWNDKKILIVDDIITNVLLLEEILAATGARCSKAFNGREALEFVRNNKVDLILMDIRMPVMSGVEAAREIKRINRDILIITQTAYINSDNKKEILSFGFDDYIEKPIKYSELLSLIDSHFRGR
ncbi:MAG: response regulator, partial [Bacteroidales bacterium]